MKYVVFYNFFFFVCNCIFEFELLFKVECFIDVIDIVLRVNIICFKFFELFIWMNNNIWCYYYFFNINFFWYIVSVVRILLVIFVSFILFWLFWVFFIIFCLLFVCIWCIYGIVYYLVVGFYLYLVNCFCNIVVVVLRNCGLVWVYVLLVFFWFEYILVFY